MKYHHSIEEIDKALVDGWKESDQISCDELLPYYIIKLHENNPVNLDTYELRNRIAKYWHALYKVYVDRKKNKIDRIRFTNSSAHHYVLIFHILQCYTNANNDAWSDKEYTDFIGHVCSHISKYTNKYYTTLYKEALVSNLTKDFEYVLYKAFDISNRKL